MDMDNRSMAADGVFQGSDFAQALFFVNVGVDLHTLTSRANPCSVAKANPSVLRPAFQSALELRKRNICLQRARL